MTAQRDYERAWSQAVELGMETQLAELATRAVDSFEESAEAYGVIRWGRDPDLVIIDEVAIVLPGQTVVELGVLECLEYSGAKADGADTIWFHAFHPNKPRLCINHEARLVVVGGSYVVNERGIVG